MNAIEKLTQSDMAAVAYATACFLIGAALSGCIDPGRPAAYSNTQNIEKCIVVIADKVRVTDEEVKASSDGEGAAPRVAYDILSQAQNLENSGTTSADQRQTPTLTVDTDADLDVPISKTSGAKVLKDCVDGACAE